MSAPHTPQSYPPRRPCPCGSRQAYGQCCGPLLSGERFAPTPETLMRSRYSAHVLRGAAYLQVTWHPSTRPDDADSLPDAVEWLGLSLRRVSGNTVSFTARYQARGRHELRERSTFVQEGGRWFYLSGVEG
ncbi:YchJ family metal-binding protein [Deinococcus sp.]|uniref:YchJ family protein n=1 Tax=Deinococcus sp. TaxID=47478 RepID=UPI0025DFEC59|nr:YchJ family metal-binding protein [Deinococcus sp.]